MKKEEKEQEKKEQFLKNLEASSASALTSDFTKDNHSKVITETFPTGFPLLDLKLDGGIPIGTTYIGAIPSLGKSTFVLQMAYNMSKQGTNVIYFSEEMRAIDIVAKLISRETREIGGEQSSISKTARDLTSKKLDNFTEKDWEVVNEARDNVTKKGSHLYIVENKGKPQSIDDVYQYVKNFISATEKRPILIIDYLQILATPEKRRFGNTKEEIDYNIRMIRTINLTFKIPVVVISSFNRERYDTGASFVSFKESGSIESDADVMIGLQLAGCDDKGFDTDFAKSQNPRIIEAKILKQRLGETGVKIKYSFFTRYNYFREENVVETKKSCNVM